jgi:hypothetical protein
MTALTSLSINKRQLDERGNSPGWMWVESGLYRGEAHYSDEPIWIMQAKEIESA